MSCSSIFRSHCLSVELRSISYREGSAIRNLLAPRSGGLSASAYRGLSTKCFIGANRIGPLPEREPTAYTLITTVSCFEWAPRPSQRGFGFCTTSVGQAGQGVAMAIGKARRRAVDSPKIRSRTRCELTLVVILSVLTIFLFPSMQGPYSVVRGPATAFRAARSAAIAYASIVQGAMHSIRNSPGSPPRALNCTRHQSISAHIAAAIPNINEVFWR